MLFPTLIMGVLALLLLFYGYYKGEGQHIIGMQRALHMTLEILPLLILAFIAAGMVQVLIPQELVSKWIGEESGLRGIFIGTLAGALSPGGPYVSIPLAAGFLKAGASMGTLVAYITGWALWSVTRLPMEVGILGWRFTLLRLVSTLFFPPIAGLIAQSLSIHFK